MVGKKQYSDEDIHKLGKELIDHCERDDVFHLVEFTRHKGKTKDWLYYMIEKYPDLSEYHRRAKDILGAKIVRMAFEAGNNWAIQTFIPMYLDDVWDFLKDKIKVEASAKAEAAKEAMQKDPEHPYWEEFAKFMEGKKVENSPQ